MAIIRKAPNGELVSFPDGTTEQQIQETCDNNLCAVGRSEENR